MLTCTRPVCVRGALRTSRARLHTLHFLARGAGSWRGVSCARASYSARHAPLQNSWKDWPICAIVEFLLFVISLKQTTKGKDVD